MFCGTKILNFSMLAVTLHSSVGTILDYNDAKYLSLS